MSIMKTNFQYPLAILFLLCGCIFSCSKDDGMGPDNSDNTSFESFEEVIASGNEFPDYPSSRTEETINESEPTSEDYNHISEMGADSTVRFVCTSKTVRVLDGNGQFPLFNTAADVIYPGSLLQGKSLGDATPAPIVVKRAGGTISYDLNNGNLSSSFAVEEVKKSTIQDGMNNIISNAGDVVPANFQLEIVQIDSENQLALELGIDIETYAAQVSANMSFSSEKTYNRTLVKLNQSYYTMSFDLPTSLEQVFHPTVSPAQLSNYVQADNPATFISSVTYGRIFYMLIESTSSREEMSAKLDAAYGKFKNSVEAELEVNTMNELNDLKIKVIAYGGDAQGAINLSGVTSIDNIAERLAESTEIKAGLPLSYVVRSVERPDQIVGTELATEYDIVDCQLKGVLPPSGLLSLVDLFSDDEDGGGIGALAHISESNVLVFNKMGTKYAWYNANGGDVKAIFGLTDENSPLGVVPLEEVGAAMQIADGVTYLFDGSGLKCSLLNYEQGNWDTNGDAPTSPIGVYRVDEEDGDEIFLVNNVFGSVSGFPFANLGFEAGARVGSSSMTVFAKPGNQYARLSYSPSTGTISWGDVYDSPEWYDKINHTGEKLFGKVGSASNVKVGSSTEFWYLVNEAGDQIMQYTAIPDRRMDGPWVIN